MDRPVPWWLRVYLFLVAFQGIVEMGMTGMFFRAHLFLPFEVSPLNSAFIGALYLAGGIGVLLCGLSRTTAETRIFVIGFALIMTIATIVTVAYWDTFSEVNTPWAWTATYIVDAAVAIIATVVLRLWRFVRFGRHRFSPIFEIQAVVMGLAGLLLVLAPDTAIDHWPWKMTAVLARIYGTFFLAYGVAAALAAWESHLPALRNFATSSFLLMVLSIVAALPHLDRFSSDAAKLAWFASFGLGAVLLAVPLVALWGAPGINAGARPLPEVPQ
jgi:hypothetical protein